MFNTEIELFEESRSSPLEEYADDVVYVLLNSNIDVVVFEDLDRFDSIGIGNVQFFAHFDSRIASR